MYISYFDESGDDGNNTLSSRFFILTSLYMHEEDWQNNYDKLKETRILLKEKYGLPVKLEFHTKGFIKNQNPYRNFNYSEQTRKEIIFFIFEKLQELKIKIINVVIDKQKLSDSFDVLERALQFNIQRIENDLSYNKLPDHFMIITDEGRTGKMTYISRKLRKVNNVRSKYYPDSYSIPIKKLIDDPLQKQSHESYFIQLADLISFIINLYCERLVQKTNWPSRVLAVLNYRDELLLLDKIKTRLNLKACKANEYGIKIYPI